MLRKRSFNAPERALRAYASRLLGTVVAQSLDVPGAAVVAFVAFAILMGLMWLGPHLGPRRRKS